MAEPAIVHVDSREMLIVCVRLGNGYGVGLLVLEQALYFLKKGWKIVIASEDAKRASVSLHARYSHPDLRFVEIHSNEEVLAAGNTSRVIVVHTPPYYHALSNPVFRDRLKVFYDAGEPPAELFDDHKERVQVNINKYAASVYADLIIAISDSVKRESLNNEAIVARLGNTHLLRSEEELAQSLGKFRNQHSLQNKFLVLNVTRFYEAERQYKGVLEYIQLREMFVYSYPELAELVEFMLIGRAGQSDVEWAQQKGLFALSNVSNEELANAYTDANLYISLSQWEGYNLGIAEALAAGLDVCASDRGAHSEFGIYVENDLAKLAKFIKKCYENQKDVTDRLAYKLNKVKVLDWNSAFVPLEKAINAIENPNDLSPEI